MKNDNANIDYKIFNRVFTILIILILTTPTLFILKDKILRIGSSGEFVKCCILEKTGKRCGACGITRSIFTLYNGNLESSVRNNPAGVVLIGLLLSELLLRFKLRKFYCFRVMKYDILHLVFIGLVLIQYLYVM